MVRWTGNLIGALVMAGFALLWWVLGTSGLGGWSAPLRTAGLLFGVAFLLIVGWRARRVPGDPPGLSARGERRFDWIIFSEAGVILLVVIVGNALGVFSVIPPLIALVAGLYFFPLAWLFDRRGYLVLGVLMTLLGIASLVALPWLGRAAPFALPGLGSAVLLWGASLISLLTSRPVPAASHRAA